MATELKSEIEILKINACSIEKNNANNVKMVSQNGCSKEDDVNYDAIKKEWGFDLSDLYRLVIKFYKEQSGKAVQLTYSERCHLVALTQQVSHGPYNDTTAATETLGFMDVVGRDRRLAWQSLGSMSAYCAKYNFITELHRLAPTLKPYIEACWADHLHQLELEEEKIIEEETRKREEIEVEQERKKEQEATIQQEQTKRDIQTALNQQTYTQFRAYADHQFPGNPEQQGVLIRQLQEQHYQQYMQQVYQQQLQKHQHQAQQHQLQLQEGVPGTEAPVAAAAGDEGGPLPNKQDVEEESEEEPEQPREDGSEGSIAAAAMWTRRDVKEFKAAVQQEGPNTVLRVGHGETVTVRVPTHQDGSCLFWEFATDAYDIGFGLYFEWTNDNDSAVTVHVTESDDDDDEDGDEEDEGEEEEEFEGHSSDDVERGGSGEAGERSSKPPSPPQSVIIPVYRRDSHEEVYAGSHTYPGTGVYLLKFDNSYSLWRSKTLYYRVYYTQ